MLTLLSNSVELFTRFERRNPGVDGIPTFFIKKDA